MTRLLKINFQSNFTPISSKQYTLNQNSISEIKPNSRFENSFWTIALGASILTLVALYNGFPLVYSDTGTYISSGFEMFVPLDRPIAYGIFLRITSVGLSPWLVILIQNLITSYVLYSTVSTLIQDKRMIARAHLISVLSLTFFSGIAWYSNQLMPDFITPLVILILFVLMNNKKLSWINKTLLTLLLIFGFIAHLSNLLMGLCFAIMVMIYWLVKRKSIGRDAKMKLLYCIGVVIFSWCSLAVINRVIDKEYNITKGSHVFLMAHLNDAGILRPFLCEHCNEPAWQSHPLCPYKDSLPCDAAGFIWGSHLVDSCGGWKGSKAPFDQIIHQNIIEPRYLAMNAYKFIQYGLVQLGQIEIGHGLTSYQNTTPLEQIQKWFPLEENNYKNSRQNRWNGQDLNFEWINLFQLLWIAISCLLLIYIFFTPSLSEQISGIVKGLIVFVLLGIFINAMITGGLNSPYGRLQARVVWLLPYVALLIVIFNKKYFKGFLRQE